MTEPIDDGPRSLETAIRLFRDGNQWCCVGPNFRNLKESPAGFGSTPTEAVQNFKREATK